MTLITFIRVPPGVILSSFFRSNVESVPGVERVGDGLDLRSTLFVSEWGCVLGCVAEVETLSGWRRLAVPPGTQHGDTLRVVGAGVVGALGGSKETETETETGAADEVAGDHVFVIQIRIDGSEENRQRARRWLEEPS